MKQGIVFISSFLLVIVSNALTAQVRVGLSTGLNLAKLRYEPRDSYSGTPHEKALPSYRIGGLIDIALKSPFAFQTGVLLTGKGGKATINHSLGAYTRTMTPTYLEIPADFFIKPYITRDLRLYLGLGPYLSFGIGGKSKYSGEGIPAGAYAAKHTLNFGNGSEDDMTKREIGGTALAGFEFSSGLLLGVQYGLSFTNNAPKRNNDAPKILRNKVFGLSIGYLFTSYRRWPSRRNYYYY